MMRLLILTFINPILQTLRITELFDIFPEIQWPNYKLYNGMKVRCTIDHDCPFLERCCNDPIFPSDKFCCTKHGNRNLISTFIFQDVAAV